MKMKTPPPRRMATEAKRARNEAARNPRRRPQENIRERSNCSVTAKERGRILALYKECLARYGSGGSPSSLVERAPQRPPWRRLSDPRYGGRRSRLVCERARAHVPLASQRLAISPAALKNGDCAAPLVGARRRFRVSATRSAAVRTSSRPARPSRHPRGTASRSRADAPGPSGRARSIHAARLLRRRARRA